MRRVVRGVLAALYVAAVLVLWALPPRNTTVPVAVDPARGSLVPRRPPAAHATPQPSHTAQGGGTVTAGRRDDSRGRLFNILLFAKETGGLLSDADVYAAHLPHSRVVTQRNNAGGSHCKGSARVNLHLEQVFVRCLAKRGKAAEKWSDWWMANPDWPSDNWGVVAGIDVALAKTTRAVAYLHMLRRAVAGAHFRIVYTRHTVAASHLGSQPSVLPHEPVVEVLRRLVRSKDHGDWWRRVLWNHRFGGRALRFPVVPAAGSPFVLHLAGKSTLKNTEAVVASWLANPDLPFLVVVARKRALRLAASAVDCFNAAVHRATCDGEGKGCSGHNLVVLSGLLDAADLAALFSLCEFQLMPSAAEGYGLAIAEAATHAQQVITTDAPPMNELCPPALSTLVPVEGDADSWGVDPRTRALREPRRTVSPLEIAKAVRLAVGLTAADKERRREGLVQHHQQETAFFSARMAQLATLVAQGKEDTVKEQLG